MIEVNSMIGERREERGEGRGERGEERGEKREEGRVFLPEQAWIGRRTYTLACPSGGRKPRMSLKMPAGNDIWLDRLCGSKPKN